MPVHVPAYTQGRTIANLAAHIGRRFGSPVERSPMAPLASPALGRVIDEARHIVLLLLDGVGCAQINRLSPSGPLAQARVCEIESTFPSSTAPAITTFATGKTPAEHAVTGWHLWSPFHRAVVRPLPLDFWGAPEEIEPGDLFQWSALTRAMRAQCTVLQPSWIADSAFSQHAFAGSTRRGYTKLSEVRRLITEALTAPAPEGHYVYVYLPHFDMAAHEYGCTGEPAYLALQTFELLFADIAADLVGTRTLLLATADHGFIDVPPEQILRIESFPRLVAMLESPLSGEPRVAFCRVRPGLEAAFTREVSNTLGDAVDCHESAALIEAGCFGPATCSASLLRDRIGTHTLIGRDHFCLTQSLPGEAPATFVGMHGGTHADEVNVPVAAVANGSRLPLPSATDRSDVHV
jgi:hypothetical protein